MSDANPTPRSARPDRRHFLSRLAALGATLGLVPARVAYGEAAAATPRNALREDPWMTRLSGSQRVVFHSHLPTDGLALRWAQTFLDTQRGSYGLTDRDCGVVVGLNGRAIGWAFADALWAKYPTIGDVMGAPGTKNPHTAAVAGLLPRGVLILACANSIRAAGQRFLPPTLQGNAEARTAFAEEVRANLLPGVEVVPSMVVTLQQAQDRACRYVYAGG